MIKKLFGKTDHLVLQFFRYLVVGGLASIVDFGLLFIFTEKFGIHYLLSGAISFLFGLVINYSLSILWVFSKRNLENRHHEFLVFTFIGIIGLGLNEVLLWFFTEKLLFYYLFSKIMSVIIVVFWNFGARKLMLFK